MTVLETCHECHDLALEQDLQDGCCLNCVDTNCEWCDKFISRKEHTKYGSCYECMITGVAQG